jgi:TolB protein
VFHDDQANYDIYVANADGSGEAQFVMGEASQPAASWDGRALAFRRWKRDGRGIVAMDLIGPIQGANYHRLTTQSFMEDDMPAWSPDGGTILFASRRESDRQSRLYTTPSGGGQDHALEQNFKPIIGVTPNWLKDGRIIYNGCSGGSCGLIAANRDGSDPKVLTDHWTDSSPACSPDGTKIAFMSQREGNWEVFVANVDGSGMTRLTNNRVSDGLPTWSPDGANIAFVSNEGGAWGIWVVGADGSNLRQLWTVAGSIDGRVAGEDETKSRGWVEERICWIP